MYNNKTLSSRGEEIKYLPMPINILQKTKQYSLHTNSFDPTNSPPSAWKIRLNKRLESNVSNSSKLTILKKNSFL